MIYFAQPKNGGPIRIGSSRDVDARRRTLGTWMPGGIEVVAEIPGNEAGEFFLHEAFNPIRVERDWFRSCSAMWKFIATIECGVAPNWLPAETDQSDRVEFEDIVLQFGDVKTAMEKLRYGALSSLSQAVGTSSKRGYALPAKMAFHAAMSAGVLPEFITSLHGLSARAKA